MSTILQDADLIDTIPYSANDGYLRYMGLGSDDNLTAAFFTTFILLAVIILTAMVLVIKNSFAMSTSEKISEFGVLRCVGASPSRFGHRPVRGAHHLGCLPAIGTIALHWRHGAYHLGGEHWSVAMLNYLTLSLPRGPFLLQRY